ncbi:MAG: hypothetical protein AABX11_00470 [Nanoarchaeota archaeon]
MARRCFRDNLELKAKETILSGCLNDRGNLVHSTKTDGNSYGCNFKGDCLFKDDLLCIFPNVPHLYINLSNPAPRQDK